MPATQRPDCRDRWHGFTAIEVLIVIGLMGLLVGLTLQGVQSVRSAAAKTNCADRMRQIGLALHQYHNVTGRLPAGAATTSNSFGPDAEPSVHWLAKLLPYIEQDALAAQMRLAHQQDPIPWHNPPHTGLATVVRLFTCPADSRLSSPSMGPLPGPAGQIGAFTSYLGVKGGFSGQNNGVLGVPSRHTLIRYHGRHQRHTDGRRATTEL